ncbi:phasin family protein [Caenimonas aquaedulcis]|uniref:Phasin family protein n=1 Tax=Caenimonas aquaedulcis TaxID=2793270 RepID=A0A931MIV0_9BURK|nr:phasin family protein [Caenimonas aquaedulcis]MBG9390229.1 phasin family protein [Caenimonas aquaedulcis]
MKAARNPPAAAATFGIPIPWNLASDQQRQQLAVATESACAVFRGFEAIRKIQERAAHQALHTYSTAAEKLKGPCDPQDVMGIQSHLMRFDMESATQYWQQLAAATMEMQAQLMNCGTHLINTDAVLEAVRAPLMGEH